MTNIAIENGPVEIVDLTIEHGDVFHSYVSLPEGIITINHHESLSIIIINHY